MLNHKFLLPLSDREASSIAGGAASVTVNADANATGDFTYTFTNVITTANSTNARVLKAKGYATAIASGDGSRYAGVSLAGMGDIVHEKIKVKYSKDQNTMVVTGRIFVLDVPGK
jgi:hypothetical protein